MKTLTLIAFIIISPKLFSQNDLSEEFKSKSLNSTLAGTEEVLSEIEKYDLSNLLMFDKYNFDLVIRGYIGEEYQRIQIHLISAIKNPENSRQYFMYGKSKVNSNICEFMGTVDLINARYYKISELDTVKQGFIMAQYRFNENPRQKHTGVFSGILKSNWFINTSGQLKYDDITKAADGYSNNEFVGIWTSYTSKKPKVCNWAHGRIPYSRNFDIGTGEFYPDKQYHNKGWDQYMIEYEKYIKSREVIEWWK